MSEIDDLADFLLARIAEDEAAALEAMGYESRASVTPAKSAAHYARWDPDRVYAECDAKRRIVEAYREERYRRDAYQSDDARAGEDEEQATRRRSSAARCRGLEIAVEMLAVPYADRPGYDEAWRP